MLFKRLRYIANEYPLSHSPDEVWAMITDPHTRRSFDEERCYRIEDLKGGGDKAGDTWTDVHTGEHCAGDIVHWVTTIAEAPHVLQATGVQIGFRQSINYTVRPSADGCILKEEIVLTPGWSRKFGASLMLWVMFVTGLLVKMSNDKEQTEAWFRNLETALRDAARP